MIDCMNFLQPSFKYAWLRSLRDDINTKNTVLINKYCNSFYCIFCINNFFLFFISALGFGLPNGPIQRASQRYAEENL